MHGIKKKQLGHLDRKRSTQTLGAAFKTQRRHHLRCHTSSTCAKDPQAEFGVLKGVFDLMHASTLDQREAGQKSFSSLEGRAVNHLL